MMHLLWLIPFVAGLVVLWWEKRAAMAVAALVALVCGLVGLAYLVMRPRGAKPLLRGEQEPDTRDVERDVICA
jgi:hypothetical protein